MSLAIPREIGPGLLEPVRDPGHHLETEERAARGVDVRAEAEVERERERRRHVELAERSEEERHRDVDGAAARREEDRERNVDGAADDEAILDRVADAPADVREDPEHRFCARTACEQ